MRWLSRGLGVEIKTEKMESIRGSCVGPTYYDEWILNNAEELLGWKYNKKNPKSAQKQCGKNTFQAQNGTFCVSENNQIW